MILAFLSSLIMSLPTFDQLPISPEYPPHTAWGVWGKEDNLGTLNLLTEERVANVIYHA